MMSAVLCHDCGGVRSRGWGVFMHLHKVLGTLPTPYCLHVLLRRCMNTPGPGRRCNRLIITLRSWLFAASQLQGVGSFVLFRVNWYDVDISPVVRARVEPLLA